MVYHNLKDWDAKIAHVETKLQVLQAIILLLSKFMKLIQLLLIN